jgi:hypothetical protein
MLSNGPGFAVAPPLSTRARHNRRNRESPGILEGGKAMGMPVEDGGRRVDDFRGLKAAGRGYERKCSATSTSSQILEEY